MTAAKAVALWEASQPAFARYAAALVDNARALARALGQRGARILTGGTDNNLVMLDVRSYGLTGRQAEAALYAVGLTCNRNTIPNDPHGAWYTSGVRIGTAATTSLGMGVEEMREVAEILHDVLSETRAVGESRVKFRTEARAVQRARRRVSALLARHPLYPGLELA